MTTRTRIGIAVVESRGQFLVGRRAANVPLPDMAEFPGGKCDADESPKACAVRECQEETGLIVMPHEQLATIPWSYAHGDIELHFWKCRLAADLPSDAQPSAPFRWVSRDELATLNFPPANRSVLDRLLKLS